MADKTIKVKVDVETDVEPSIAALKALKKQLRETAAGSEDFIRLQQQIDDVQDSLVSARAGAGNFADVLGGLPGPIGQIGGQLGGTITTLKQFSALKLANIQASFVELGKDITDIAKGLFNLTGITKAYTVVNNFLAASFVKVGIAEGVAATGAKALSAALISTGIGALIVLLGTAVSALMNYFDSSKKAEKAADDFSAAIKRQNDLLGQNLGQIDFENKKKLLQAKIANKSQEELNKIEADGLKQRFNLIKNANSAALQDQKDLANKQGKFAKISDKEREKLLEKNLENITKLSKDESDAREAIELNSLEKQVAINDKKNQKIASANQASSSKNSSDRKREIEELKKSLEEARLATLSAKDKELEEVRIKYDTLKAKAVKFGEDTKIIEQARQKANTEIADKYAAEDKEKADKVLQDKLTAETLALDLRVAKGEMSEGEYQKALYDIRKQYAVNNDDLIKAEIDLENFKTQKKKDLAEEERGILATRLQSQIEALDAENARIEGDFQQDLERLSEKRQLLNEQEQNDLANTELTEFQRTEIRKKYADARKNVSDQEIATEKAAAQAKQEINMAYLGLFEQFGNTLSQLAGKNKALAIAGIVISQAASIGQIIAQTSIANAKAVAANPLGFGQPWVTINTISAGLSIASTIASAAKSIQQINSQPGASAPNAGGASAGAPSIAPPRVSGATAPQIQTGGGQNPTTQIGETIAGAQRPIRAYVVSGEVTSQQALDRRTSRAATFSAG
jgi:hypothetical protein